MTELEFKNKAICIAGSSKGIGFALAKKLDGLGARLLLHASSEEGISKLAQVFSHEKHVFWQADFKHPERLEDSLTPVLELFGPLDAVVNCVGLRSRRPIHLLNTLHVQETFNANIVSFIELVRLVSKKKRFNPGLSIVSISSIAAHAGAPGVTAYAATKGALEAATKSLAKELSKKSVRVNCIICGQVETEAYEVLMSSKSDAVDPVLERQYMGLGKVDQVVEIVGFLLSSGSSFINGASIPADGGFLS